MIFVNFKRGAGAGRSVVTTSVVTTSVVTTSLIVATLMTAACSGKKEAPVGHPVDEVSQSPVAQSADQKPLDQKSSDPSSAPQVNPKRPGGTVTSGGGLIHGNRMNPWFLPGQAPAKWCSVIDETNFGAEKNDVDEVIREVLASWKVAIAVDFEKAPCGDDTDLTFYLGKLPEGTTDESIVAMFDHEPEDVAGIAVRTAYDDKARRGRGFIYIAPHEGAHSFARPEFVQRPWTILGNRLLRITIAHEVGHVFGLEHSTGDRDLMGSRLVESLLQESNYRWLPYSDRVRAAFIKKLDSYTPRNLITLPEEASFTRCDNDACLRFKFALVSDRVMVLHVWKWTPSDTPGEVMQDSRLEHAVTLEAKSVGFETLASVTEAGKSSPVIVGTRVTYSGRLADRRTVIVDWTAGRTPRVILTRHGETKILLH